MIDIVDFHVIGELKSDPKSLLLLGDDGQCYAFDMVTEEMHALRPDESRAVDVIDDRPSGLSLPVSVEMSHHTRR